jgi:Tfp pilus assembly protein PilV
MVPTARHRDEDGFTIVEVMVAAVVLLVGILGVTMMVNTANGTTTTNKAREQGLSLARQLLEDARSVRYQALRPATVVTSLQAINGLGNAGAGPGWTIRRRNIVYTVSVGVCSVDDPGDGTGAHAAASFCTRSAVQATPATCQALIGNPGRINGTTGSPGPDGGDCGLDTDLDGQVDNLVQATASSCPSGTSVAAGTCDAQPDDFKRLVTLVTWDRGGGTRSVLQQATVPFPGLSAYGAITALTLNGYSAGANGYVVEDNPSSLTFHATSNQQANQADWLLGGVDQGPIASWSGTQGDFTWGIGGPVDAAASAPASGEVLDGGYLVGARVQDAAGIHGIELDTAVTINRRVPFAPSNFTLADDRATGAGVTASWTAPPDHDIIGYDVVRTPSNGGDQTVCSQITSTSCTDPSPPNAPTVAYRAYALDRDASGTVRRGQVSATKSIAATNQAPSKVTGLARLSGETGKTVTLNWSAASDSDGSIQKYEIFRDGVSRAFSNFPPAQTTYSETAQSGNTYIYQVRAIDDKGLAGPLSDPLTVNT